MFGFLRGPAAGKYLFFTTAGPGGAEFKAYRRTGWWEDPNAFAGIAGAPFRDNQNARSQPHLQHV